MSYRPIADVWILARPKVAFYGAYPAGFLERAQALLAVRIDEPVLHVCSGKVRDYPYFGMGDADKTLDLDPELSPDFCQDARDPWPQGGWKAVLIDPPYTGEDATHYTVGSDPLPTAGELVKRAWEVLPIGGRVGVLHYLVPRPPKDAKFVAVVGVMVGYGNRMRAFSVFEKRTVESR